MNSAVPRQPVLILAGPTATGKTDLAVQLVQRFPVEIISVDSALIYRQMNIGTAKPDAETLEQAPHHLINILDPVESWSAWSFVEASRALIEEIHSRGKLPLLVGGTMMYFNALIHGMNELPQSQPQIRQQLLDELEQQGCEYLHQQLSEIDPVSARQIKATDPQRILRALEVYRISGQAMSRLQQAEVQQQGIDFRQLILDVDDRSRLHQRIAQRFHLMLEQGFEQEVTQLKQRGDLNLSLPSMRCVGYRQMWQYLESELGFDEMTQKSIIATRQLAKRQLTWSRKFEAAKRMDFEHIDIDRVIQHFGLIAG